MSEYRKLVTEFMDRYEKPVIEEYIQGFSGIDPPLKANLGINDHEDLIGLLGGDEKGHYHLTREQLDWIIEQMSEKYPPQIMSGQVINTVSDEAIDPYEIRGENIRRM